MGIRPLIETHGAVSAIQHLVVETSEQAAQYAPVLQGVLEVTSSYALIGMKILDNERGGVISSLTAECQADNPDAELVRGSTQTGLDAASQILLAPHTTFHLELKNLHAFTTYRCQLFSSTLQGRSSSSAVVEFKTGTSSPSKPRPPTVEVVADKANALMVTWAPPSFPGADIVAYQLWLSLDGGRTLSTVYVGQSTSFIMSFADESDMDAAQYQVSVTNSVHATTLSDLSDKYATDASTSSQKQLGATLGILMGVVLAFVLIVMVVIRRAKTHSTHAAVQFGLAIAKDDPWYIPPCLIVYSEKVLGRGQFGYVREAAVLTQSNEFQPLFVAAKLCHGHQGLGSDVAKIFWEEAEVMKNLSSDGGHHNVVKLAGISVQVGCVCVCVCV